MTFRTLTQLEADIRYRYDLESFTARHPQANVFALINAAYRTLRDRLTSEGSTLFATFTEFAQSTTGRSVGFPGTLLAPSIPRGFQTVLDVHVRLGNSWVPLRHAALADALTDTDDSVTGEPRAWCLAGLDTESGGSIAQGIQILITPPLDAARAFRVHGVLQWPDITATESMFTDFGMAEYVVAAVGVVLCDRDDDVALYQARYAERETVYRDVKKRSCRRDPTPTRRVNVRGRR
jgi:hypothetical protein